MKLKERHRKIILFVIILFFCINIAWGSSEFYLDWKYEKTSGITIELEELKEMTNNTEIIEKIENIQEDVKFLTGVCFEE